MNTLHDPTVDAPLRGRSILLTRPQGESNSLGLRLQRLGATVFELPTIAIEPPRDPKPLEVALQQLARYDWIVFSSRNAVRAIVEHLRVIGLPVDVPAAVRVAAVGESTAAELEAEGIMVDCLPERASAAALAERLVAVGIANDRILLPFGNLGRRELPDGLRAAGAVVDEVEAYRTVAPHHVDHDVLARLIDGTIDVVVFGSPSALTNLFALLPSVSMPLRGVRVACMGPTTAAAARAAGIHAPLVATPSTLEGLMDVIVSSFRMENQYEQV